MLIANFKTNSGGAALVQQKFLESLKDPSGVQGMQQNLGTAEQALAHYQTAIAATQKAVEQYVASTGNLWKNVTGPGEQGLGALDKSVGGALGGGGMSTPMKPPGGGAAAAPDTTGIDTAMTKLAEFKTQIGELPNLINAALHAGIHRLHNICDSRRNCFHPDRPGRSGNINNHGNRLSNSINNHGHIVPDNGGRGGKG